MDRIRTMFEGHTARRIPAGVLDATLASMATFGAGLAAVVLLDEVTLGVYGLFFAAFQLGVQLPINLVYTPAEVVAVARPPADRLRQTGISVAKGLGPAAIGLIAIPVAAAIGTEYTTSAVLWAFALPAGIATILSPAQDHARRLLHIGGRSWAAASVSAIQLGAVGIAILAGAVADVDPAWIPFGSLAAANAFSLATALALAGVGRVRSLREGLELRSLARSGFWLVVGAIIPAVAAFGAAAIITRLAGAAVYGYAEAARQMAQPIVVFATGLTLVLGPRITEAAQQKLRGTAMRARRAFAVLLIVAGGLYLLYAGPDWPGNIFARLVPIAYEVPWLVAATIIANILLASAFLYNHELLGAGRALRLAVGAVAASPFLVIAAFTAGTTEAFARPLGFGSAGAARTGFYAAALRGYYARSPELEPVESDTVSG